MRSRRLIGAVGLTLVLATAASAQQPPKIADNSLLLEEAYNQEAGVVQHISLFGWSRRSRDWTYAFTQEWPYKGQRHQLSYQVALAGAAGAGGSVGLGDVQLYYRYQLAGGEGKRTWVAPRFSVSLPTGSEPSGHGSGALGFSVAIPVSVELTPEFTVHFNLGGSAVPATKHRLPGVTTASATAGASAIWAVDPRINLMVESLWSRSREVTLPGQGRWSSHAIVNPAVRWSFNYPSGLQIVPAIGYAIDLTDHGDGNQLLLYLSFEHSFGRRP